MERRPITFDFALEPDDVEYVCSRSSGAGGQHVNTTDSAVQLRYSLSHVPERMRGRIKGNVTGEGILLIDAREHRSQLMNREAAYGRLIEILLNASREPKVRKATKPTRASKLKRLASKKKHSDKKRLRGNTGED